jgi:uncharacterized protein with PQ loop repeat
MSKSIVKNIEKPPREDAEMHESLSHYSVNGYEHRNFSKTHPRHRLFAKWYDRYMIIVAILASIFVYLQASLIMYNKSSENVSMPSYILLLIVALSWMIYGILWTDWIISLSGIVASIGAIIALVATISYRPSSTPGAFTLL